MPSSIRDWVNRTGPNECNICLLLTFIFFRMIWIRISGTLLLLLSKSHQFRVQGIMPTLQPRQISCEELSIQISPPWRSGIRQCLRALSLTDISFPFVFAESRSWIDHDDIPNVSRLYLSSQSPVDVERQRASESRRYNIHHVQVTSMCAVESKDGPGFLNLLQVPNSDTPRYGGSLDN